MRGQPLKGTPLPEERNPHRPARKLRYSADSEPGIRRTRVRGRFRYHAANGRGIGRRTLYTKMEKLGIAPRFSIWE